MVLDRTQPCASVPSSLKAHMAEQVLKPYGRLTWIGRNERTPAFSPGYQSKGPSYSYRSDLPKRKVHSLS